MKMAASFPLARRSNGKTAQTRLPKCKDAPVGFTPVMIFFISEKGNLTGVYGGNPFKKALFASTKDSKTN